MTTDQTKRCTKCSELLPLSSFSKRSRSPDGLNYNCKLCWSKKHAIWRQEKKDHEKNRKKVWNQANSVKAAQARKAYYEINKKLFSYRARVREGYLAQRSFAHERAAIIEFYKNRPEGHHVDHIVPLRGLNVSGLHVLDNLQYLPAEENIRKSNHYAEHS